MPDYNTHRVRLLIEAVKAHALRNYNQNDWDIVVEAWTDDEIAEVIVSSGAFTSDQAIRAVQEVNSLHGEQRMTVEREIY